MFFKHEHRALKAGGRKLAGGLEIDKLSFFHPLFKLHMSLVYCCLSSWWWCLVVELCCMCDMDWFEINRIELN